MSQRFGIRIEWTTGQRPELKVLVADSIEQAWDVAGKLAGKDGIVTDVMPLQHGTNLSSK